jgi:hypothetical protein
MRTDAKNSTSTPTLCRTCRCDPQISGLAGCAALFSIITATVHTPRVSSAADAARVSQGDLTTVAGVDCIHTPRPLIAPIFFVVYIMMTTYLLLNLFIGAKNAPCSLGSADGWLIPRGVATLVQA